MIDTDNFKAVNDNLGHQYGDEAILFVANAIKETFRESDFIGRVGGDEFMVFMKHTTAHITAGMGKAMIYFLKMLILHYMKQKNQGKTSIGYFQIS